MKLTNTHNTETIAMTDKMTVVVEAFTPRHSNTLRGFCSILIPQMHLRIHDVAIHEKGEWRWCSLPAKPQITREGVARKDEHNKIVYATLMEFADKGTREAFSQRVVAALLEFAPSAFEVEEVARPAALPFMDDEIAF